MNLKMKLIEALHIEMKEKMVISVVGAGGKTTCIHTLKDEFVRKGKKVVITTTTHMYLPHSHYVLDEDINAIKKALAKEHFVIVGTRANEEKMKGVSQKFFEALLEVSDVVLVEADGSRRLPVKMPAAFEPALAMGTQMVIVVTGIESIGRPVKEVCHRFEIAQQILGVEASHLLDAKDIATLIYKGYLENRNAMQKYAVFINKVTGEKEQQKAEEILSYLKEMDYTNAVVLKEGKFF